MRRAVYLSMVICLLAACLAQAESAKDILKATGVRGGLIVHLGCGDGKFTAALKANESFIVQGLDTDSANVAKAQEYIKSLGMCGKVSFAKFDGESLPYADNLVNLLVSKDPGDVSMDEVMRVLAPNGVAYIKSGDKWQRSVKAWPKEIDEWTHFLHDASNNAVADDTKVGPSSRMQWVSGPRWARSHEHLASMSAAVSASGRIFYIIDEGPISSVKEAPVWKLVARDAFNGTLLWEKDIDRWEDHLRPFRSGPAELPRRLVAIGQRVYVTLGYDEPVIAMDAATGEVVHTYRNTENTHEIIYHEGNLYLVISEPLAEESSTTGEIVRQWEPWREGYAQYVTTYMPKHIKCIHAETGKIIWEKDDTDAKNILPLTLAANEGKVFFENEKKIIALDGDSGKILWATDRPVTLSRFAWSGPTLVIRDGVVLSADRSADVRLDIGSEDDKKLEWFVSSDGQQLKEGQIIAFSAETGQKLWTADCHEGYNFPPDVFVAQDKVWSGILSRKVQPGLTKVYDLHSGEIVDNRPPDQEVYSIGFGHHRCYRNKATSKYVIHGRSGVEFLDMNSDRVTADHWIRGTCQYGILPCNGLLYVPPHSCACYITAKLNNFNVLAPGIDNDYDEQMAKHRAVLEKGPAYRKIENVRSKNENSADWPTYRNNALRSGATASRVPSKLRQTWKSEIGGKISSPVAAAGKIFVTSIERHTVHAIDAAGGRQLWSYMAGGRVDSAPTIHEGLVYFGCADGWVYCLRANDGKLVWRFRAAPWSRQIVSYDQLESVWPLHGNLLIDNSNGMPVVYAVAGRSSFTDGGLFLSRINAKTGELLSRERISHRDPETGLEPQDTVVGTTMPGALPDILSSDGESVFMRHMRFDMMGKEQPQTKDHLYSSVGFLDDSWWHRTYWQFGKNMLSGYGGWYQVGSHRVSGRILVLDNERIFGFGRKEYEASGSHIDIKSNYHLFSANTKLIQPEVEEKKTAKKTRIADTQVKYHWSKELPFFARAMLLADNDLFVAGPSQAPYTKKNDAVWLWQVSAINGEKITEYKLEAAPVFDGMIAASGKLYISTIDGNVVCFEN